MSDQAQTRQESQTARNLPEAFSFLFKALVPARQVLFSFKLRILKRLRCRLTAYGMQASVKHVVRMCEKCVNMFQCVVMCFRQF